MTPDQTRARDFAARMLSMGFQVYLSKSGTYGFVTDAAGSRVLTFSGRDGALGGTYGPPSTRSGTGWRMDSTIWDLKTPEDVRLALYAMPPPWVGDGWKRVSTASDYLAIYGSSSGYAPFTGEIA